MIGDLIKNMIGPIISPLIDRIPDPNERERAKEQIEGQMLAAMTSLVQGQLEINKQEAQHKSLFVAGWRPSVGWVCSLALAWNFIFQPLLSWVFFSYGLDLAEAPRLDTGELTTVLLGMLGLGGLRTYEKRLGVQSDNMGKKK